MSERSDLRNRIETTRAAVNALGDGSKRLDAKYHIDSALSCVGFAERELEAALKILDRDGSNAR